MSGHNLLVPTKALVLTVLRFCAFGLELEVDTLGNIREDSSVSVHFVNFSPHTASIYWDDGKYGKKVVDSIAPHGGDVVMNTYLGHVFFWTWEGSREALGTDQVIEPGCSVYELPANTVRVSDEELKLSACSDRYPRQCRRDARSGSCQTNPGWMAVNCPASCDYCEFVDPARRCDRARLNMSETPFLAPGDLDRMYERILGGFPELRPRALSRPPDGPWVVLFERFLEDAEIDNLIMMTEELGFVRSTDQGAENARGEVKKVVSKGRTSENAWCTGQCEADPLVRSITDRITRVTGVPAGNYEQFQVLRYREGQYYRPHHDAGPSGYRQACGVRILTFFLYLSDVEQGGGTRFPSIKQGEDEQPLTVTPRRGQAILWPSVNNEDPGTVDYRTLHEALPVEHGIKFAANHWIHDFDFRIPNLWGCTGAFD